MNEIFWEIMMFVFLALLIAVILVIRYEIKKKTDNMLKYVIMIIVSLLISFLPVLLAVATGHRIYSETVWFSFKTALSIMVLYLSAKIPQFISRYKSIEKFRAQAYGIAMEMCSHTQCNYSKLKNQMDDAIKYYDVKNLSFRCSEESRIAFMENQPQRFVYLCALDYVWKYVDEDWERKSVEAYCVPPPSDTGLGFEWHVKNPFWESKSQEAGFAGFGVAIALIAGWFGADRS